MSLSPREALARRKLLTRCRGILLDNEIFTPSGLVKSDLLDLAGVGPKAADLIADVAIEGGADYEFLFPYPDGIDNTRFGPAVESAAPGHDRADALLTRAFDVIDRLLGLVVDISLCRGPDLDDEEPAEIAQAAVACSANYCPTSAGSC